MTTTRINISQPRAYVDAWQLAANAEQLTLSDWIARACNAQLPADVRGQLPKRPKVGRPVFIHEEDSDD